LSWAIGCRLQKLLGQVDLYHGIENWDETAKWINGLDGPIDSIQFWGHGSPGLVYITGKPFNDNIFRSLKKAVNPNTILWFRTCSTFQGYYGHYFSKNLSNALNCVVAGHTRIIGPLQGGLHTRSPNTGPSWPMDEGEFPKSKWPSWLRWGNNTVTCLATKIPKGW
jgi:hypothetical protein